MKVEEVGLVSCRPATPKASLRIKILPAWEIWGKLPLREGSLLGGWVSFGECCVWRRCLGTPWEGDLFSFSMSFVVCAA